MASGKAHDTAAIVVAIGAGAVVSLRVGIVAGALAALGALLTIIVNPDLDQVEAFLEPEQRAVAMLLWAFLLFCLGVMVGLSVAA